MFLVDTGYAGPPVLSTSYLAIEENPLLTAVGSVQTRYPKIIKALTKNVTASARDAAIESLLRQRQCLAFTSGCTMRLMSIGATEEQQADMLLCPSIMLATLAGGYAAPTQRIVDADVVVSNPLPHSIHILTCDYLLHASPVLLDLEHGCLDMCLDATVTFAHKVGMTMHTAEMNGGAFVIPIELGGQIFRVTMDTGAPGPVTLGSKAASRLTACTSTKKALTQEGVNGEHVCSDIVIAEMRFAGVSANVPVLINDHPVEGVDGYVGLGILRAVNILITHDEVGFLRNSNAMRDAETYMAAHNGASCAKSATACEL